MPIKPLEAKTYRPPLFKLSILIALIVIGIMLDKTFLKKNKDIPIVLGMTQELKQQTQEKLVKKVQESTFINDSINKVDKVSEGILGKATETVNKLASDTGFFISNVIYSNSIGKVVEQIDKLPKDQQERIREQICK